MLPAEGGNVPHSMSISPNDEHFKNSFFASGFILISLAHNNSRRSASEPLLIRKFQLRVLLIKKWLRNTGVEHKDQPRFQKNVFGTLAGLISCVCTNS